jgi:hypothetical protein
LRHGHSTSCRCSYKDNPVRLLDLTGKRFNRLTVIDRSGANRSGATWNCRCDCGQLAMVSSGSLRDNHTKSCGCLKVERDNSQAHDLTGKCFGRLVVLKRVPNRVPKRPTWLCQCDCGNTITIFGISLTTGETKSCGRLKRDWAIGRIADLTGKRFGYWTIIGRAKIRYRQSAYDLFLCVWDNPRDYWQYSQKRLVEILRLSG